MKVKPLKMLGLAALAALMAMAFIGVSSAMAETTLLCTNDSESCSAVAHVHETTLAGSPAVLLNSVGNVLCDVLFLSTSVGGSGAPQIINGNFTYSNCLRHKSGGGTEACTVTELNGPSEIKVLKEGHETATVTGEGETKVKCGFFINCTYNDEGLVGTFKGPLLSSETNGSVLLDNQTTTKVSGFFCPTTAELDITTTPLGATYLGAYEEELEMACIEVEAGEGFFLGHENGKCTGEDESAQGNYEMAYVLSGTPNYQHVCAKALWPRGVYNYSDWQTCSGKAWLIGTYILGIRLP